jgi:cysteinyl-tRNA synthetase
MLRLYNSLTRKKEEFKPIHPGKVGMYVCGPTVYEHCHLGHARGYVSMDVLRRYLEYLGYEVRFIMNYTDVGHQFEDAEMGEDKIESRAKKEKIDPMEIADRYIQSCREDFDALNIKPAKSYPRPTRYIAQIIKFVEELIKKRYAYEVNGSVYFTVDKFSDYGKLSGRKKEDLVSGARVEVNLEKKNSLDFALWIKAPKGHILKWPSPWSEGYPGWHIECSVMSNDLLGQDTFDIHGGGNENKFPHNENEIAQSEAYLGKKMCNFWTLWNMVNVNGVKMSKSLGNYTTAKEAIKKYSPMTVRLWILSSHYLSVTDYTQEALKQAKKNLQRINDFINNLSDPSKDIEASIEASMDLEKYRTRFEDAMNDDLNTPLALSVLYELITETNKLLAENKLSAKDAKNILSLWKKMNNVFGLVIKRRVKILKHKFKKDNITISTRESEKIPKEIIELARKRGLARRSNDFVQSDEIRKEIEKAGYLVEDLKENEYKIKRK